MATKGEDANKPVKPPRKGRNTAGIEAHQFKPGKSGNPKGRSKGSLNVRTRMKLWLNTTDTVVLPDKTSQKVSLLDSMILGLIKRARNGDAYAFNALMDRFEGKVADRVVIAGDEDNPLVNEVRGDIDYDALDPETLKKVLAARRTVR